MMQQNYVTEGILGRLGDLENHSYATQIVLHDGSHASHLTLPAFGG